MLSLDWGRALSGQVLFRRFRLVDLVELPVKPPGEENSENPLSSLTTGKTRCSLRVLLFSTQLCLYTRWWGGENKAAISCILVVVDFLATAVLFLVSKVTNGSYLINRQHGAIFFCFLIAEILYLDGLI